MKSLVLLIAIHVLFVTCFSSHTTTDPQEEGDSTVVSSPVDVDTTCVTDSPAILESYVERLDTVVGAVGLSIYMPHSCEIEYIFAPDITDGYYVNQMFLAAAFTGVGWENGFDHKLIAGDHVSRKSWETLESKRYRGYPCERNTGAFVYYNGHHKFLYKNYSHELDSAATNRGIGFGQEMIVHKGEKVPTIRKASNENQFRALCEWHRELCVIESKEAVHFGDFSDCLIQLSVTEALYLDMGGWNYSWYRNKYGEVIHTFPRGREKLTNAIIFRGAD